MKQVMLSHQPVEIALIRPVLERNTSKIQASLMALAGVSVLLTLVFWVMSRSLVKFIGMLPQDEASANLPWLNSLFEFGPLLILLPSLAFGLGAIWQTYRTLLALNTHVLQPSQQHTLLFRHQARVAQYWLRAAQIIPVVLFLVTLLIPLLTGGKLEPGTFADLIRLVVNWLVLEAVMDWLEAVGKHVLGNKSPIDPKAGRMGAWFLFLLIPLGFGVLTSLVGGILVGTTLSPSYLRNMNTRFALTPDQAGELSRMAGSILMLGLLSAVAFGLGMALLLWLRQLTGAVTQHLDLQTSTRSIHPDQVAHQRQR